MKRVRRGPKGGTDRPVPSGETSEAKAPGGQEAAGRAQGSGEPDPFFLLSHDMLCIAGFDGYLKRLNPAWEKTLGFSIPELLARPYLEFVAPEDRELTAAEARKLAAGRHPISFENRCLSKGGAYKWLVWDATPFPEQQLIYAVVRDVTERKRAEEEIQRLNETEEQFRLITENIGDLVALLDPEGKRLYNSPSYKSILGEPATLRGTISFEEIHPEDREKVRKVFEETVRTGVGQRTDYRFLPKDGSVRYIESQGSAIRDSAGKVVKVLVVSRDVTERKKLEQQLLHSQKMEAIGQLAGGVAHDFNNLLTIIAGYSELLLESYRSDTTLFGYLTEIKKAGDRATSLTRQLLAFSRQQVLAPQVLNLNDVVANIERMLERLIGEDINLVTHLAPDVGRVKADPGQIEQVVMNLAVNARDAMPRGGKLTIETANVELDQRYARGHFAVEPGSYVTLKVSDTGTGMDPATLSRMFDPFFTTKEKGKGTGLGLSTVYGIVKQSGGSILVSSEIGRGTTFDIYFARVEEGVEPANAKPGAEDAAQGSETILIVEDEAAVRSLIGSVLEPNGYTVLEASRGDEALRVCQQHQGPIHLLLTDDAMPEIVGPKVAECLAAKHPEMKALLLSGYAEGAIVREGFWGNEVAVLEKPFTPEGLLRKVREVLAGRQV